MAESRFTIAEYEAELAAEYTLQALAHQLGTIPRPRDSDIDIDPWRPLFESDGSATGTTDARRADPYDHPW